MNNTAPITTPEVNLQVKTLPDMSDVIEFKDGIINIINDFLHTLAPDWEIPIIIVFSVLIALVLKKKYDEDAVWATIVAVVIYLAVRGIGIGG